MADYKLTVLLDKTFLSFQLKKYSHVKNMTWWVLCQIPMSLFIVVVGLL